MKLYALFYKVLFALGLGWHFNRLRCRLDMYSKFPDGRCHFCGETNHGLHWRFAPPPTITLTQQKPDSPSLIGRS